MGSKFISTYTCDIKNIENIVGSNNLQYIEDLNCYDDELPFAKKIVAKSYTRDPNSLESPDAGDLINVFQLICSKECTNKNTFEVYVDDENSPELFKFTYSSWSEPDNLKIPISEWGTPSVTYISPKDLGIHKDSLEKLIMSGDNDEEYISDSDLNILTAQIKEAIDNNHGLFVFFSE